MDSTRQYTPADISNLLDDLDNAENAFDALNCSYKIAKADIHHLASMLRIACYEAYGPLAEDIPEAIRNAMKEIESRHG